MEEEPHGKVCVCKSEKAQDSEQGPISDVWGNLLPRESQVLSKGSPVPETPAATCCVTGIRLALGLREGKADLVLGPA